MQESPKQRSAPLPRTATAQVADSVMHAMLSVGRVMRRHAAGDALEPASFWVLKNLAEDSMRITELATCIHLDTSTVSRHLTQLERAGLIERSPDPQDGRAQRVGLSAEGRRQLRAAMDRRRELMISSLQGWTDEEIDAFNHLLARFVGSLEHLTTDLSPS